MKVPAPTTPANVATWQKRPIRFGLHRASTHAGSSPSCLQDDSMVESPPNEDEGGTSPRQSFQDDA